MDRPVWKKLGTAKHREIHFNPSSDSEKKKNTFLAQVSFISRDFQFVLTLSRMRLVSVFVFVFVSKVLAESASEEESNPFLDAANALLQEAVRGKSGADGDNGIAGVASGMFGLVQTLMASQGGGKNIEQLIGILKYLHPTYYYT